MLPGPKTARNNAILLVLLLFFQLLLMAASLRGADGVTRLESWTMTASSPLIGLADLVGGGIDGAIDRVRDLFGAHRRNAALEEEVAGLRSEVERYRESHLENARLRELLAMRPGLAPRAVAASVVTSIHSGNERMLVVDHGSADGIEVDQPVVAWGGAVGRIDQVGRRHAKVRLLTHPWSGVAGTVQASRAKGMVLGVGDDILEMRYVPRLADVGHGDRVVTSGLVGIFPRGFGIGTVISIDEQPDGSRRIGLAPELDYRSLEEVLILLDVHGGELLDDLPEVEPDEETP